MSQSHNRSTRCLIDNASATTLPAVPDNLMYSLQEDEAIQHDLPCSVVKDGIWFPLNYSIPKKGKKVKHLWDYSG